MKLKISILLIIVGCSLSGCSGDWFNRGVYNSIQEKQRWHCDGLIGHQRDDCLARLAPAYDDYKKTTKPDSPEPEN